MKSTKGLIKLLRDKGIDEKLITDVINSGYILKKWVNYTLNGHITVSDKMYGNKQFSSKFEIDKFIEYIKGNNTFSKLPKFNTYRVKNRKEIEDLFKVNNRDKFINNGQMSFRGQVKEYTFKRKIPNPLRADNQGNEISILPGALRNIPLDKDASFIQKKSIISYFLNELEPNNPNNYIDSFNSADLMRVEQHYAEQTYGLDISYNIETAIFFATYKLNWRKNGTAYHTKIEKGKHQGVIYCFVFRDPPVRETEYLIKNFDLFKTYTPERILRQNCGLPLFSDYDRNIAICDIDCIIYLDSDFDYECKLKPEFMFPNEQEDKFYAKLMELKKKYPKEFKSIVEYKN